MKSVNRIPGLQECVLQNIVGILVGQHNLANLPVQLFAILAHHQFETLSLGFGIQQ